MKEYTVSKIKQVDICTKLGCEIPIVYPNPKYFKKVKTVFEHYGILIETLSNSNYVVEDFLENMIKNSLMCIFYVERDFEINVSNRNFRRLPESELIMNKKGEKLFQTIYKNEYYQIEDKLEDIRLNCVLFIDINKIKIYINNMLCYVLDDNTNRKYCLYFG